MRKTTPIGLTYVVGFICEGQKSEPYFLNALNDWCKTVLDYNLECDIHPAIETSDENSDSDIKSGRKTRKRSVRRSKKEEKKDPLLEKYEHMPQPQNWIAAGEELLDAYSEVWVLFDKDGHPKVADAFNNFREARANTSKSFNLVFSSRCFEHYMLAHHELNCNPFDECECHHYQKGKRIQENCCTSKATANACNGDLCINGYARRNGYWEESKNDQTFKYMPNLWRGILWAWHITWRSICKAPSSQPYEDIHNPFLNIYSLTTRLMGYNCVENYSEYRIDRGAGNFVFLSREGNDLIITNNSRFAFRQAFDLRICILPDSVIHKFDDAIELVHRIDCKEMRNVNQNVDLQPNASQRIKLDSYLTDYNMFALFTWDNMKMFIAPILEDVNDIDKNSLEKFRLTTVRKEMLPPVSSLYAD